MSKQLSTQSNLYQLLAPIISRLGYICWGMEFFSTGGEKLLRIYIDNSEGIKLEDCEKVSHQLSAFLDVETPITENYRLEISSPGLDRPFFTLEQMSHYIDEQTHIKLRKAVNNRRKLLGKITHVDVENNCLTLLVDDETINIDYQSIETAKLALQF